MAPTFDPSRFELIGRIFVRNAVIAMITVKKIFTAFLTKIHLEIYHISSMKKCGECGEKKFTRIVNCISLEFLQKFTAFVFQRLLNLI